MSQKPYKVLLVEPGKQPYETEIGRDLKSLQNAVGGLIEVVPLDEAALLVCNEEGKLEGLPGNRYVGNDIIAGNFFVIGDNHNGGFCSLNDEQLKEYSQMFADAPEISPEQVEASIRMEFYEW